MAKYIIVLKPMSAEAVKTACAAVVEASVGTGLTMDWAYVDKKTNQPICCWDAPDQEKVEDLFRRAGQQIETLRDVEPYHVPCKQ
ncbi:hypothetical protein FJY70_01995 [candidate division WOR-3 bacterium]|nr:hypothetical protein [candidate division WOR-3 bacterium]